MTDQIRGLNGALSGDAYRTRDFETHAELATDESLAIAREHIITGLAAKAGLTIDDDERWQRADFLARRIVVGEYIGRHEGPLDDTDRPTGPGRYAKPAAAVIDLEVMKRRHLAQAKRRVLAAVRRSQP